MWIVSHCFDAVSWLIGIDTLSGSLELINTSYATLLAVLKLTIRPFCALLRSMRLVTLSYIHLRLRGLNFRPPGLPYTIVEANVLKMFLEGREPLKDSFLKYHRR